MNSIIIDEEGFPLFNELRLKDEGEGQYILSNISYNADGYFQVPAAHWGVAGNVAIEAFDTPWVVRHVGVKSGQLEGELPYGLTIPIRPKALWVDEWDRFRGHGPGGIPFVFSRSAQMEFFDLVDEFNDESFVWQGETIEVKTKQDVLSHAEKPKVEQGTSAHSALVDMVPRLKLPKSRILCVLQNGEGDISEFFRKEGHIVHVKYAQENRPVEKALKEEYDFIFVSRDAVRSHAARLKEFFKSLKLMLGLQGTLFVIADLGEVFHQGTLWVPEVTEWEMRESLKKDFDFLFWGRWKKSPAPWDLRELFIYAQKKRTT